MSFDDLIAKSGREGLEGAVWLLLKARNLKPDDDEHLLRFASELTLDFSVDPQEVVKSKFKKSCKDAVNAAINDSMDSLKVLYACGEEENLLKLIRVITAGEVFRIWDDEISVVMAIWESTKQQTT